MQIVFKCNENQTLIRQMTKITNIAAAERYSQTLQNSTNVMAVARVYRGEKRPQMAFEYMMPLRFLVPSLIDKNKERCVRSSCLVLNIN